MEQDQPHGELQLKDEAGPAVEQPGDIVLEPVPPADEPACPASPPTPSRGASMVRGAMRGLFAFVFSQYAIVTVIVTLAAVTLSRTASGVLITKFDAIARALRNF